MHALLGFTEELVAVATPISAATLSVIVFYLRSMREHQLVQHAEMTRRLERVEDETQRLSRTVREMERSFATKEEWLRETMSARQRLDALTRVVGRMQAQTAGREGS